MSSVTIARANVARRKELTAERRTIAERATAENRDYTTDERAKVDELRAELDAVDRRIDGALGMESRSQQFAAATSGPLGAVLGGSEAEGLTSRPIGGVPSLSFNPTEIRAAFDAYEHGQPFEMQAEARATLTTPAMAVATEFPSPVVFRREPTRVSAFLPAQEITGPTAHYYTQGTAASAAAAVAEAGAKPQSTPAYSMQTVTARKLAHHITATTESLADFPSFEQLLRDELIRGLAAVENAQILTGNGTAPNLQGLNGSVGILTFTPGASEAFFLSLLRAQTLLRAGSSYVEPDLVVLNPTDYEAIVRTPATTAQLIVQADPTQPAVERIWGMRLVVTTQQTAGVALVMSAAEAAVVFWREMPVVKIDPFSSAINNVVNLIGEQRIGLGVIRPSAICRVTFTP